MPGGDIGIGDLVERRLQQAFPKIGVLHEARMIHAQYAGGEKTEKIEIVLARAGVPEIYAPAAPHVQHQGIHAAHQQMLRQNATDVPRRYRI